MDINKQNIRVNVTNGIAFAVGLNLVSPYYAKLAARLGATNFHFALLKSFPSLVSVFALIPGAMLIEAATSKLDMTAKIILLSKIPYLMLAGVPFLPHSVQATVFVLIVGLMNFPTAIGNMGYQSSIGDIFKPESRNTAMALRTRYSEAARLVMTFAVGQILFLVPANEHQTIILYQLFFVIAFIIGLIEVYTYYQFKVIEEPNKANVTENYLNRLKKVLRDIPKNRPFLVFTSCSLLFYFGWQMGWPIFDIYMIKNLEADELWLSYLSIAGGVFGVIAATQWGKYADLYGNRIALSVATFGLAFSPIFYMVAKNLYLLVVFNIFIGIAATGATLILFNRLLEVTPDENRTLYIAVYTIIINISAAIAPMVSVGFMNATTMFSALLLVTVVRILGSLSFFLRMDKQNSV